MKNPSSRIAALAAALALAASGAQAAETTVTLSMAQADGAGPAVGTVRIVETPSGLVFYPQLAGLPPGLHGFHVHENPSCGPSVKDGKTVPAGAAGGHFDPLGAKHHGEPWGDGHLGDLPPLYVSPEGTAQDPVLAPRLMKVSDVLHHALTLHAGGDNRSDSPAPLGGGGGRVACGVIGG
jgi:Cu-Zn family superoxide dismutase